MIYISLIVNFQERKVKMNRKCTCRQTFELPWWGNKLRSWTHPSATILNAPLALRSRTQPNCHQQPTLSPAIVRVNTWAEWHFISLWRYERRLSTCLKFSIEVSALNNYSFRALGYIEWNLVMVFNPKNWKNPKLEWDFSISLLSFITALNSLNFYILSFSWNMVMLWHT